MVHGTVLAKFPLNLLLVNFGTICEEMRNASKNFFAFKGAPYMVNLISIENFLNNSRFNDLLAKEVSRNLQKVPTRIIRYGMLVAPISRHIIRMASNN